MSKEIIIDKDLQIELMKQLEKLETSTDLEGTAIISKTGLRIASSSESTTEVDLHSAGPATIINLGNQLSKGLNYGELSEIVITGDEGYTIITVGDEQSNFMLLSHCKKASKLGYYFHRLRKAYKNLSKMLKHVELISAKY
ncbi:MAG: roadblock/LC7 domain-containing protein [Promethearchaeota archaeon]